jgi:hypothetical protein
MAHKQVVHPAAPLSQQQLVVDGQNRSSGIAEDVANAMAI